MYRYEHLSISCFLFFFGKPFNSWSIWINQRIRPNHLFLRSFTYLFFYINKSKLILVINRSMKTKKELAKNKRDVIDRFLSILWRKEVGDLRYTTK